MILQEATTRAAKRVVLASLERRLARGLTQAFSQQGRIFVRDLGETRSLFPGMILSEAALPEEGWGPVLDKAEIASVEAFRRPLNQAAEAAMKAGLKVKLRVGGVGVSLDVDHPKAVDYLQAKGAQRVQGINTTTRTRIRKVLQQAGDEGWSYQLTAKKLTALYKGFGTTAPQKHIRSRAELIAVTELGDAYEAGSAILGDELEAAGIPLEKSLLTVGDTRVCRTCIGDRAAGWIPWPQPFPSGHLRPVIHPACRCTLLTRPKEGD